jgi:hypothetical protein
MRSSCEFGPSVSDPFVKIGMILWPRSGMLPQKKIAYRNTGP